MSTWFIGQYDSAGNHPPSIPTGLAANNITETGFTLSWNASTDNIGVTGYEVFLNGNLLTSVTDTFLQVTGLNASTMNSMTVSAWDTAGNFSNMSTALNVTTPDNHPPSIPTGLAANNLTETSFTLSWNTSTDNVGVTGYNVFLDGSFLTSVTCTSVQVTGLSILTVYSMTVSAMDAADNVSSVSTALNVTTPDTHPPGIPEGLAANSITETGFTLSWHASTDNVGVTGYNVFLDGSFLTSATGTSIQVTGLTASTMYSITVSARDAADNVSSVSAALNVTTPDTHPPGIPAGLGANGITETGFTLSWNASTDNVGVTGYNVFLDGNILTSATGTSIQVTGLTASTMYSITVSARDAADNVSSVSAALNVTTPDTHPPGIPAGLGANGITETGFTLSWNASTDNVGVTGYNVFLDGNILTSATGTSIQVTGLTASTMYSITVSARDAADNVSPVSAALNVTTPDTHPPGIPAGLGANGITETGFTLSWNASTDNVGVTGYNVFLDGNILTSATDTSIQVTGLTASTMYSITVSARDAADNVSPVSAALNVTTPDTHPPGIPAGLGANGITETGFTLSWNASTDNVGVTGYNVFLDGNILTSATDTSVQVTGLTASTMYSITVSARDAADNVSPVSAALNVTTPDTHPPGIPAGLAANGITETGFTLSWNASTDNVGVTGYNVFLNGNILTSATDTSVQVTGLTASTMYSITVSARDAADNVSPVSAALNVTTPDTHPPGIPAGLGANGITETGFTLSWNASTDNVGVTGYNVYLDGNILTSATDTSVQVTGLTASTMYLMTVSARDAADNVSPVSAALNVTTPDTHPPGIPGGLAANSITETGFTLSWNASTDNVGVTGYNVYLDGNILTSVTDTSIQVTGLTASTMYLMTVSARDAADNVSEDATLAVSTNPTGISSIQYNSILVYPNPVHGSEFNIDGLQNFEKVTIDIIDLNGVVVFKQASFETRSLIINTNCLKSNGMYLIKINIGEIDVFRKIIVQL